MTARRVTLRDIAQELGVSHVTVSRALRNDKNTSNQTIARVKQLAEKMGYSPDPMLSALSHYRLTSQEKPVQSVLAWINPWKNPERMHEQQEFNLYWEGASKSAKRLGFTLEEFCTNNTPIKRLERIFKTRKIQGILIAPQHDPDMRGAAADLSDFAWEDFSTIRFGRTSAFPPAHFVTSAQSSNTMMTFDIINKKGYRRIGYIGPVVSTRLFATGYVFAQQQVPVRRRIPPLLLDQFTPIPNNMPQFSSWVKKYKPDAIITDALEVTDMLAELGLRIPEDIGIASTSIYDSHIDAGIDQNPIEIGHAAVRALHPLLIEQTVGAPKTCNEILIPGKWVDGTMLPDRR